MQTNFDATTAVTPMGDGVHAAELDAGWAVGGGLNGGYVLAVVGRAIAAELPAHPDPIAVSAYFLAPAAAGPAEVRVRPLRVGRTATVAADLAQDGVVALTALATFGDLSRDADDIRTTAQELELPPREECVSNEHAPPEVKAIAPLMDRFDMRFHPDDIGWAVGEPSGTGVLRSWFRLEEEHEPDPISLLQVVDAMPPTTFTLGAMGWAPTVELTAHVRGRPAPGWLKVVHATRNLAGGFFEEDCEVWDSSGRLVAQSRQLARLPRVP